MLGIILGQLAVNIARLSMMWSDLDILADVVEDRRNCCHMFMLAFAFVSDILVQNLFFGIVMVLQPCLWTSTISIAAYDWDFHGCAVSVSFFALIFFLV